MRPSIYHVVARLIYIADHYASMILMYNLTQMQVIRVAQLKVLQMSSCSFFLPCRPQHRPSQVLSPAQAALDPAEAQTELCSSASSAAHWESTCHAQHNDAFRTATDNTGSDPSQETQVLLGKGFLSLIQKHFA